MDVYNKVVMLKLKEKKYEEAMVNQRISGAKPPLPKNNQQNKATHFKTFTELIGFSPDEAQKDL